MATKPLFPAFLAGTVSGNAPQTIGLPEKATQTYKPGAILTLDANGYVAEAGADPVRILGVSQRLAGNAATDGVGPKAEFWVANRDNLFRMNIYHSTVESAVWDHRYVGRAYGIIKVGDNWHVDIADISNRRVIIQELDPGSLPGDLQPEVIVQFLSLFSALSYTS